MSAKNCLACRRAQGSVQVGRVTPRAPLPVWLTRRAEDCPPYQYANQSKYPFVVAESDADAGRIR